MTYNEYEFPETGYDWFALFSSFSTEIIWTQIRRIQSYS
jgi:hypothetical protein